MCVFKESLTTTGFAIVGTALHAVTTHAVIALRSKTDVPHDGNVDATDCRDGVKHVDSTLKFDGRRTSLDETNGATNALLRIDLVRTKR